MNNRVIALFLVLAGALLGLSVKSVISGSSDAWYALANATVCIAYGVFKIKPGTQKGTYTVQPENNIKMGNDE